jgi:hypothetical protein
MATAKQEQVSESRRKRRTMAQFVSLLLRTLFITHVCTCLSFHAGGVIPPNADLDFVRTNWICFERTAVILLISQSVFLSDHYRKWNFWQLVTRRRLPKHLVVTFCS